METNKSLLQRELEEFGTNPIEISEAELVEDYQRQQMKEYREIFLDACLTDNVEKIKEIILTDFLNEEYAIEYIEQSFVQACFKGNKNVVEFFLNDLEWKNEKNTQNLLNEAILISKKDGNNENVKYLTELLEVKNEENLQINSTSKPKM